ncbi:MAG: octaprenyl diphosphate synthase [Gammaproteobacteria bacterium]|jgi:octaprenyl-diphosphate synthase|nr:octaprenyl diphosphate synthase [Gammaproteobacteria bacterium]
MQIEEVRALVSRDMEAVNDLILERLRSRVILVNQLGHYIVGSGGKRLRPLLVLLGARAFAYSGPYHVNLAAVIEFIHTATLLHDDVVDASDLRRGQETANAVWGNEASVLVGDFLYSRAFQMMVEVGSLRVMDILAETTNVIAEGEVRQLLNCHDPEVSEARYLEVVQAKTAKLFEAGARLGPVLAGGPPGAEEAMAAYGMRLGTAFQLVDDVLDYRSSPEETGKNVGDDLAEGKPTLPLIHALRTGSPEQAALVRAAIEEGGREHIGPILEAIEATGALDYTLAVARAEAGLAIAALEGIPDSPYKEALRALAEFSVLRTH